MENKIHKTTVKNGKINLIDIFIFLFVIAIVLWCCSYYYDLFIINNEPDSERVSADYYEAEGVIRYTVVVYDWNLGENKALDISLDPIIKNSISDKTSGKITKVEYEKYIGQTNNGENGEKTKAVLTIEAPAIYIAAEGYFVSDLQIRSGEEIPLMFKVYSVNKSTEDEEARDESTEEKKEGGIDSEYIKTKGYCLGFNFSQGGE